MHLSVNLRAHDSMQNITFLTANLEMKLNKKDNNKVINDRNSLLFQEINDMYLITIVLKAFKGSILGN